MDLSPFAVAATYATHLPVRRTDVRAVVHVDASGIGEPGAAACLRLWTPRGATVSVLREIAPMTRDLLRNDGIALDERTTQYDAGRWTGGARAYELAVEVPARAAGDRMLAVRVTVVVDGQIAGRAPIAVEWTCTEPLTAPAAGPAASSCDACGAIAELPTGPSPQPRHTVSGEPPGQLCSGCGLRSDDGDRFCERCGRELAADQPL
jgi:hypothetical protein